MLAYRYHPSAEDPTAQRQVYYNNNNIADDIHTITLSGFAGTGT